MAKHRFFESSYRLHKAKNQPVNNKVVFLLKRKTTLVVDDKRVRFVIDNSLSPVYEKLFDYLSLFCHDENDFESQRSFNQINSFTRITIKFPGSRKTIDTFS